MDPLYLGEVKMNKSKGINSLNKLRKKHILKSIFYSYKALKII